MRKLSWIIAGILCTTPLAIQAAELGAAKVQSQLTERLNVLIPLTGLNGAPVDEVKVRLAPESYYRQAGLSLDQLAGNITFQIKTEGAKSFIVMSSKRIITDPILSVLVEVTSGDSQVIKEFDLLLNPPVHGKVNQLTETAVTGSQRAVASAKQANTWQPIANAPQVPMGGSYQVQRGDTLYDIAKRATQDNNALIRPMMQAIINANPAAFVGGNGNELKSGVTLKVPTSNTAKSTAAAPVVTTKKAATEAPAPAATAPKLQLLSSDASAASAEPSSPPAVDTTLPDGKLAAIDSPAVAPSTTATTADAAAASSAQQNNEAIASIDAKSQAMSQQISMLNEQLKQVQGLITDRNQNIESLQQKIKESNEQTQLLKKQLESQNSNFWVQWAPYLLGGAGLLVLFLLLALAARGRKQEKSILAATNPQSPAQKIVEPDLPLVSPAAKTALGATDAFETQSATPTVVDAALPVFHAQAAAFDPKSMLDEAQLLRSYGLNEQGLDLLRDGIVQHADELPLYQALASAYAEDGREDELNQIFAQIDSRFGSEHRPDVQLQAKPAMDDVGANEFDDLAPEGNPSTDFIADRVNTLSPSESLDDLAFDFPISASANQSAQDIDLDAPLPLDQESQGDSSSNTSGNLSDLDFDLASFDEIKQPISDKPQTHDLDLELSTTPSDSLHDALAFHDSTPTEPVPSNSGYNHQNDTRLGLAEAFLGVGDRESYLMIADEIESEGNQDSIAALRAIELKYQS